MKIKAKRFDKTLKLPEYESGAAGFDFVCRKSVTIKPGEIKAVPGNIALQVPAGYVLLVAPRSSTANKYGLSMPHSIGVVDPFYNGNDNEIALLFYNFTSKSSTVNKGDKIAQGILIKTENITWQEVESLEMSRVPAWRAPKRRK